MAPNKEYIEKCLFYGCIKKNFSGHHCYSVQQGTIRTVSPYSTWHGFPMKPLNLDGGFRLRENQNEATLIHTVGPNAWTILVVTDNTIDERPGSHSTFVVPGVMNVKEVLEIARHAFPEVVARLDAKGEVKL